MKIIHRDFMNEREKLLIDTGTQIVENVYVGAINILRAGHARLACGEWVQLGRSMKQEPIEVIQACA